MTALVLGALALVVWLYLLVGRGGFWLARERDDRPPDPPSPARWPAVAVVVPARNEADVIARSIGSLLAQDYPGPFKVILVDDQSSDGTATVAQSLDHHGRLTVMTGQPLPAGWTGKMWALSQGVEAAGIVDYLLLTDADIGHSPDNLRRLVATAEAGGLALVSLMARLSCASAAEKLLIPAFVFFFQMLYPFAWINNPKRRLGGGAGGCMLVRRLALEAQGGIAAVRQAIIDDCTLGARLKRIGPVRLTLTDRALSLRPYHGAGEIRRMIARTAYSQLGYSPLLLLGTVAAMAVTYLAPPLLALLGSGLPRFLGLGAWAAMALAYAPMLRFYHLSALRGLTLPLIGAFYVACTVDSAIQHWRGRGGMWKGRAQAMSGPK